MHGTAPGPAFVGVIDFNERPKLQKAAAMLLVDLVDIQGQPPLGQRGDAADTCMAIGVARHAAVLAADAVLMEKAQRTADDFMVKIRRQRPARHGVPTALRNVSIDHLLDSAAGVHRGGFEVVPLDMDVFAGTAASAALDLNAYDNPVAARAKDTANLVKAWRAGSDDVISDTITLTHAISHGKG